MKSNNEKVNETYLYIPSDCDCIRPVRMFSHPRRYAYVAKIRELKISYRVSLVDVLISTVATMTISNDCNSLCNRHENFIIMGPCDSIAKVIDQIYLLDPSKEYILNITRQPKEVI